MRLSSSVRRVATHVVAAATFASAALVGLSVPAEANHVAAMTVTQAGNQGAYVTLQVDLSYTAAPGGSSFTWQTGNGRTGSVGDGVSNGTYLGDASGSGSFFGGPGGVFATFTWTRTQPAPNVARTRITYAYPAAGVYQVAWSDCCPDVRGTTAVSVAAGFPACSDAADNDNDGDVDYPGDAGCDSPDDDDERAQCPEMVGVALCVEPGDVEVTRVNVHNYDVTLPEWVVEVGRVDRYEFTLPNGTSVTLPCVVLDQAGTNACALAGGRYLDTTARLSVTAVQPMIEQGEVLTTVGICEAELVATALGFGVTDAEAFAVCDTGNVSL